MPATILSQAEGNMFRIPGYDEGNVFLKLAMSAASMEVKLKVKEEAEKKQVKL